MKKGWIIALSIAAGLLLLGLVLVIVGEVLGGNLGGASAMEDKTAWVHESFERVDISEISADVEILPAEDGVCRVQYRDSEYDRLEIQVSDGVLKIERKDERPWYRRIHLFSSLFFGKTQVYLPQISGEITAATVSGDLTISGCAGTDCSFTTISGDLRAESVNAQRLAVSTTSGDIVLKSIRAGSLQQSSVSGDVRLVDVISAGAMRCESTSGDVALQSCDAETLSIETVSGDVEAELLSPKRVETSTTSGDVRVPDSDSSANLCSVKTVSGDIHVVTAKASS